jgi:hypothetical protein
MRSRSLLVIISIGIGGMAGMALIMKLAFDNDGQLREITKFKAHMLQVFAARGVQEVNYRNSPRLGGAVIEIVADSSRVNAAPTMHRDAAELVLKSFPKSRGTLKLEYFTDGSGGCDERRPFLEQEFGFSEVRFAMLERQRRRMVERKLREGHPEVVLVELSRKNKIVTVVVQAPKGKKHEGEEFLSAVAETIAAAVKRYYPVSRKGHLDFRILSAAKKTLVEGEYDSRGKRRRFEVLGVQPSSSDDRSGSVLDPADPPTAKPEGVRESERVPVKTKRDATYRR